MTLLHSENVILIVYVLFHNEIVNFKYLCKRDCKQRHHLEDAMKMAYPKQRKEVKDAFHALGVLDTWC